MSAAPEIIAQIHDGADEAKIAIAKILLLDELRQTVAHSGNPIILTKGTFDILHSGHLHLIAFCSRLKADHDKAVLVVAVELDESVRRRKGPSRPIQDEQTRALQM